MESSAEREQEGIERRESRHEPIRGTRRASRNIIRGLILSTIITANPVAIAATRMLAAGQSSVSSHKTTRRLPRFVVRILVTPFFEGVA